MIKRVLTILSFFIVGQVTLAQYIFVPNQGQWLHQAQAVARQAFSTFFIDNQGFKLSILNQNESILLHNVWHNKNKAQHTVHGHNIFFNWIGSQQSKIEFQEKSSHYYNYFVGNKSRWRSQVYAFQKVIQKEIYPFTDIVYYPKGENIEWDIILHPNADLTKIKCQIKGAESLELRQGNLLIYNSIETIKLSKPFAYQEIKGTRKQVECWYQLKDNILQFELGQYNPSYDVTIDPILVFSTYSGSKGDNFGFTATYDSKGNLYAGGIVDSTEGKYPVTAGSFQTNYGGVGNARDPVNLGCDISISKYNPSGSSLLWASYYGGVDDEFPHSLVCDNSDNLLVLGTTWSSNFPTTANAYKKTHSGSTDILIGKISANGTTLIASTLLGGSNNDGFNAKDLIKNYADDFRGDIITDDFGNVYIASTTRSSNFPTTAGAYQSSKSLANDAVLVKLNSNLQNVLFSTFIGGAGEDAAYSVKLLNNSVFIGGGTSSNNLTWPPNSLHSNYLGGSSDGFIAEFSADSGKIKSGTYYGTGTYDQIYFIETDIDGRIYATGQTEGTLNRSASKFGKDNSKQFLTCVKNTLDSSFWQTTFGHSTSLPELSPSAFMVDNCYNIYFSGWGATNNLVTTANAFQKITDNEDFYLLVLDQDAKNLVYATYFGGNESSDHVDGGTSRFDKSGVVYQSVCSSCPQAPPGLQDFPVTPGAAYTSNASYRCSNASFKFDFEITYAINANFTFSPLKICNNDTIRFTNLSKPGLKYRWDFGDGDTSVNFNETHKYKSEGSYSVTLTVTDPVSCNISAIKKLIVKVEKSPTGKISIKGERCSKNYEFTLEDGEYDPNYKWLINGTEASNSKTFKKELEAGISNVLVVLKHPIYDCYDSLKIQVNTSNDSSGNLQLANIITPNADGKNDCFKIAGISAICNEIKFSIYNRWGELLFKTNDINDCWEATVQGTTTLVPDGTYYYILEMVRSTNINPKEKITGTINVIR